MKNSGLDDRVSKPTDEGRKPMSVRAIGASLAAGAVALLVALAPSPAAAAQGDGEVWVTSQGTHRLFILHGLRGQGGVETVTLPSGTGPHLINFSPDGEYAYISGMGNGNLIVMRAENHEIVAVPNFGAAGTHQAMPSPGGEIVLVAQIPTRKLIKVATGTWATAGELTLAKSPICTIFRDDGRRAYVSLLGSGIAVVDVPTMTQLGEIATDGFVACGMVKEHDGRGIMLASDGSGGHVYRLDVATEMLDDRGTLGAVDWHSFRMSPNGKLGFGSVPLGDEVRVINLESDPVSAIALPLDPTPGAGNDEPDHMAVRGNTLYVTLRESGKLAIVRVNQGTVDYLDLSPPNPDFNRINCAGCAVHGVAVRP